MEAHTENPQSSNIFADYPKLLKDHFLIDFICDAIRLVVVSSGTLNVHAVEEIMDNALKTHHHGVEKTVKVLQTLGDALPALGIRSEEHTSELQSLMRISYAVFCLKKKKTN